MPACSIAIPAFGPAIHKHFDLGVKLHVAGAAMEFERGNVVEMPADHPGGNRKVAGQVAAVGLQLGSFARVEDQVLGGRVLFGRFPFAAGLGGVVLELGRRVRAGSGNAEACVGEGGGDGQAHGEIAESRGRRRG